VYGSLNIGAALLARSRTVCRVISTGDEFPQKRWLGLPELQALAGVLLFLAKRRAMSPEKSPENRRELNWTSFRRRALVSHRVAALKTRCRPDRRTGGAVGGRGSTGLPATEMPT
jgi:hypothetical protein